MSFGWGNGIRMDKSNEYQAVTNIDINIGSGFCELFRRLDTIHLSIQGKNIYKYRQPTK